MKLLNRFLPKSATQPQPETVFDVPSVWPAIAFPEDAHQRPIDDERIPVPEVVEYTISSRVKQPDLILNCRVGQTVVVYVSFHREFESTAPDQYDYATRMIVLHGNERRLSDRGVVHLQPLPVRGRFPGGVLNEAVCEAREWLELALQCEVKPRAVTVGPVAVAPSRELQSSTPVQMTFTDVHSQKFREESLVAHRDIQSQSQDGKPLVFEGVVTSLVPRPFMRFNKPVPQARAKYCITLDRDRYFFGSDLERAGHAVDVHVGDRVRLTKEKVSFKGRSINGHKNHWEVIILEEGNESLQVQAHDRKVAANALTS